MSLERQAPGLPPGLFAQASLPACLLSKSQQFDIGVGHVAGFAASRDDEAETPGLGLTPPPALATH